MKGVKYGSYGVCIIWHLFCLIFAKDLLIILNSNNYEENSFISDGNISYVA
jgi:hypothetical protein